jgi:hypothetical protein
MEEDIIRLYQEALALLRLRSGSNLLMGDYYVDDNGFPCYTLTYFSEKEGKLKKKMFKHFETHEKALKYFIKCSQNICNLR